MDALFSLLLSSVAHASFHSVLISSCYKADDLCYVALA